MRGNLPKKEPEMLEFWDSNDIYHKVAEKNAGHPKFILHDGLLMPLHSAHQERILKHLRCWYEHVLPGCYFS